MTTTKPITSIFANKSELLAAQARVKELEAQLATTGKPVLSLELSKAQSRIRALEAENAALKSRPLAVTPKATTAPATKPTATADTYEWKAAPKPVLSREKFSALSPNDKSQFIREGGKLTN